VGAADIRSQKWLRTQIGMSAQLTDGHVHSAPVPLELT
jgi:hypothetical protein